MYDLSKIKPKNEFPYWFIRRGLSDVYDVFAQEVDDTGIIKRTRIGNLWESLSFIEDIKFDDNIKDTSIHDRIAIMKAFEDFKANRPEAIVGTKIPQEIIESSGENAAIYDKLITGALLLRCNNETEALKSAEKFLTWLHSTDFYKAPGSILHHDNYPEGLLQHSLRVYNCAITLMQLPMFKEVAPESACLISLTHDLCKIFTYSETTRNVKNDDGVWEKQPWYSYKPSPWPFGHGVTSLYLSSLYFNLTLEEALAIRHHMGRWNSARTEEGDLSAANSNYPSVLLLQLADQASIAKYIPQ